MKIKNPLKFCLVFVMFASLFQFSYIFAFGQSCSALSTPSVDKRGWKKGEPVSVYINPYFTGEARQAIVNAFNIWNTANQLNNSGVVFTFPTTPPGAGAKFFVNPGTDLRDPERPKDRIRAKTDTYTDPTTGFNTSAVAYLEKLMTDPGAIFETTVHEIGHPAGLGHCTNSGCTSQTSIMTPVVKRSLDPTANFNEIYGRVTSPTACDNKVLELLYPFPCSDPAAEFACPFNGGLWDTETCVCNLHDHTGGGGGTGGGTGGGGGGYGVYCYDVWKAEYYYGCVQGDPVCHETVEYEYVGLECEYAN